MTDFQQPEGSSQVQVTAETGDDKQVRHFKGDLLIAADGSMSSVRSRFRPQDQRRYCVDRAAVWILLMHLPGMRLCVLLLHFSRTTLSFQQVLQKRIPSSSSCSFSCSSEASSSAATVCMQWSHRSVAHTSFVNSAGSTLVIQQIVTIITVTVFAVTVITVSSSLSQAKRHVVFLPHIAAAIFPYMPLL